MSAEGKTCTKCGVWKGFGEFGRRQESVDGRRSHCRACCAMANRCWREALPDERRKVVMESARRRVAEWAKQHPRQERQRRPATGRNKANCARLRREWVARNADRVRESGRSREAIGCETLSDSYVKSTLVQGTSLSRQEIPPELVEFKREQLRLRRLSRDLKKAIKEHLE